MRACSPPFGFKSRLVENSTHYFAAGPAALPPAVKQQIQSDVVCYKDSHVSILELSHRSEQFAEILISAKKLLRELYSIPANYKIIFMHGGATAQFDAIALNLLADAKRMTYINTGFWSVKAAELAKKYGQVSLVEGLNRKDGDVCCVQPQQWEIATDSAYVHITPNETIDGIELKEIADLQIPLVADVTSCLLMRPFDINQFGLLYAGAQKTLGIAGMTVVIVREDLLARAADQTPYLYRYDVHVRENSLVNTAPVFACYVTELMLAWVKAHGGVNQMHIDAQSRSQCLYETINKNSALINKVCAESRSNINVVFDFVHKQKLAKFFSDASALGLHGLQGHRLVGGVRASMYNGTPMPAVKRLQQLMQQVS